MYRFGHRRSSKGFGARLALLAIALQLVLSFAHIHPLPSVVTAISAPAGDRSAPDMPVAGDDCAICANIAAFAALDLPGHLGAVPPTARGEILVFAATAESVHPVAIRYFHTRAPPSL